MHDLKQLAAKIDGTKQAKKLTAFSLPEYSSASWSMSGAIMRQGPHQGAQKSTRTGMSLFSTSASKVASVTTVAAPVSGVEGARRSDDGRTEREKDADATGYLKIASVRTRDASGYAPDTRRETRRWGRNLDATRNAPFPLVTSALHTRLERAGARAGARVLSCTRDLRERATFALRAVTWEVTADMVLACGRTCVAWIDEWRGMCG